MWVGGVHDAHENYFGMYRVQAAELQHDKREEAAPWENGDEEVLPVLQETYDAQGNQIISRIRESDCDGRNKKENQQKDE